MKSFKDWKIFTKIITLVVLSVVFLTGPVFFYVLPKVKTQIRKDKAAQLNAMIESVSGVIESCYNQYKNGLMSEESAKKEALKIIQDIRFEGDNYYFVMDNRPYMIMHPIKPEMNGTDVGGQKDAAGKPFFVEMVKIAEQQGIGDLEYMWPKAGSTKPVPKLSTVKYFKQWGWIIGTGIYIDDINAIVSQLVWSIVGMVAVAIALVFILSFFISKRMSVPIINMVNMIKDIAEGEGDLTKRVPVDSVDEIGQLGKWFNTFVDKVHDIISLVAGTTAQVASASQELSATSEEMASGAEEQTSQTSQVATSVEEMSATVQEVAKNANVAATSAKDSGTTAKKGGDIVQQTVDGMGRINAAVAELQRVIKGLSQNSEKIGNIIGVIDDVADQTNLLALNAAIEAARAGEQGRGFAVVADEVRKLAERTTSSTKEIAEMVRTIQEDTSRAVTSMDVGAKEVDNGVKLAEQAGTALKEIVGGVQNVQDMVQQIATAAEEQSAAAEEISSNVESIASVAKQTAAGTQQAASASQELASLADSLQSLVNKFRLREGAVKQVERKATAVKKPLTVHVPGKEAAPVKPHLAKKESKGPDAITEVA